MVVLMMYVTRFYENSCERSISVKLASSFVIECIRLADLTAVKYGDSAFQRLYIYSTIIVIYFSSGSVSTYAHLTFYIL